MDLELFAVAESAIFAKWMPSQRPSLTRNGRSNSPYWS